MEVLVSIKFNAYTTARKCKLNNHHMLGIYNCINSLICIDRVKFSNRGLPINVEEKYENINLTIIGHKHKNKKLSNYNFNRNGYMIVVYSDDNSYIYNFNDADILIGFVLAAAWIYGKDWNDYIDFTYFNGFDILLLTNNINDKENLNIDNLNLHIEMYMSDIINIIHKNNKLPSLLTDDILLHLLINDYNLNSSLDASLITITYHKYWINVRKVIIDHLNKNILGIIKNYLLNNFN